MIVEICVNDEWLSAGIASTWKHEVALVRFSATVRALEKLGFEWELADQQRATFHGWNGARFTWRCGAVGCWEFPSPEVQRLLIAADDAGIEAATKAYEGWRLSSAEVRQWFRDEI